jgi:hypothetical protein
LAAVSARATKRAEDLRETIADLVARGSASYAAVAAELNRREIEAPRGGRWYPTGIARLRQRLAPPRLPASRPED